MSKNKYGIDTDKAMDEMSPPRNKAKKMGGKKDGHKPWHNSPHAALMEGSEYAPMKSTKKNKKKY